MLTISVMEAKFVQRVRRGGWRRWVLNVLVGGLVGGLMLPAALGSQVPSGPSGVNGSAGGGGEVTAAADSNPCPSALEGEYSYSSHVTNSDGSIVCSYSRPGETTTEGVPSVSYDCPYFLAGGFMYSHTTVNHTGVPTCHYTRSGETTLTATVSYDCAPSLPNGYTFGHKTAGNLGVPVCHYTRSGQTTRTASSSTTYTCPTAPSTYTYSHRNGSTCHYSRSPSTTRAADTSVSYTCPSSQPGGFSYSHKTVNHVGIPTCHYTRSGQTTRTASSSTSYTCPTAPSGYTYRYRSDAICHYSKTVTTTKDAIHVFVPNGYSYYKCPTSPSGYSYSHRSGTTCYYTKTVTTTRAAIANTTYTCPSAPSTYTYSHRSGSICYYTRGTKSTSAPTSTTTYTCPTAPSTYTFSHRSGSTCHYTRSGKTTLTASSSTSYTCPTAPSTYAYSHRSGTLCFYTRGTKTTAAPTTIYTCPSSPPAHTYLHRNGTDCTYARPSSTSQNATATTTYTCPPTQPDDFTLHQQNGSSCVYTRTFTTTKTLPPPTTTTSTTTSSTTTTTAPQRNQHPTPTIESFGQRRSSNVPIIDIISQLPWHDGSTHTIFVKVTNTKDFNEYRLTYTCPQKTGGNHTNSSSSTITSSSNYNIPQSITTGTKAGQCSSGDITFNIQVRSDNTQWSNPAKKTLNIAAAPAPPPTTLPTPPPVPDNVRANGHTPAFQPTGESIIKWDPVTTAASYQIRYQEQGKGTWTIVSTVGSVTSTTLTDLSLDGVLYKIQVRSLNSDGITSSWSDLVYSYPTNIATAVNPGNTVGIVPIRWYRESRAYGYVLCNNQVPINFDETLKLNNWQHEVLKGATAWQTTTWAPPGRSPVITVAQTVRSCTSEERLEKVRKGNTNLISFLTRAEMIKYDLISRKTGKPYWGVAFHANPVGGLTAHTSIVIQADWDRAGTSGGCSGLLRVTMHEVGHAFGFDDHNNRPGDSVMNMPADNLCKPTSFDVVAINAVYQSRGLPLD